MTSQLTFQVSSEVCWPKKAKFATDPGLNLPFFDTETSIWHLLRSGSVGGVAQWLENPLNREQVNTLKRDGLSLVHYNCSQASDSDSHVQISELLLLHGANPLAKDFYGATVIATAHAKNLSRIFEGLMKTQKVDPDDPADPDGSTPFFMACCKKTPQLAQLIISLFPNRVFNCFVTVKGKKQCALSSAVTAECQETIGLLLPLYRKHHAAAIFPAFQIAWQKVLQFDESVQEASLKTLNCFRADFPFHAPILSEGKQTLLEAALQACNTPLVKYLLSCDLQFRPPHDFLLPGSYSSIEVSHMLLNRFIFSQENGYCYRLPSELRVELASFITHKSQFSLRLNVEVYEREDMVVYADPKRSLRNFHTDVTHALGKREGVLELYFDRKEMNWMDKPLTHGCDLKEDDVIYVVDVE